MKVLVAMSGGVDSTVAAYLLKQAGNEVIGVNFNFVGTNDIVGANDTVGANANTVGADTIRPTVGANTNAVGANANTVGADTIRPTIGASDTVGADTIRPTVGANACRALSGECDTVGADTIRPTVGANACRALSGASAELEKIANSLNIKILYRDYHTEFHDKIIKYFVDSYEHGLTPNPCAICNATMKFEKLLQVMKEENCDMIATGHYANIDTVGADTIRPTGKMISSPTVGADTIRPTGKMISSPTVGADTIRPIIGASDIVGAQFTSPLKRFCIRKSTNQQKDQSYMLYRLNQEQLSHIIFPLGNMDKSEVRNIAATLGLDVANKKDSQDVCFINSVGANTIRPTGKMISSPTVGADTIRPIVGASSTSPIDYKEFIKRYEFGSDYREKIALGQLTEDEILSRPYFKKGEFVDLSGKVLGFHNGIINYTVGQRKGFNIAFGERKFVVKIDVEKNQVVLGNNDDLMSSEFKIKDVVFSGHDENVIGKKFYAKLRYRHDGTLCEIVGTDIIRQTGKMISSPTVGADIIRLNHTGEQAVLTCHLSSPVRAITPGQSAVFYDGDGKVMLGGIIV